jgi:4-amino-4-deoxy-L-arabinose transferase-like glycosyltransferase
VREGLSRLWPVPILVLFCAPLFVGLGNTDLQNDEAIYSFAADSILETGDWLNPRSSPHIEVVFLEKPPLKFWLVALPIRLGILPHSEFGLRFWDALLGGIAFLYVFAVGRRLAGPLCGLVAVLILFTDPDLVFEHGLRSNNMEAPLVLSYCGAIYHFLAWGNAAATRRRWHAASVAAYFFLGFMTKFVAALFLPVVLVCVAAVSRPLRARVREDVWLWVSVAAGVVLLAAPWFIYQALKPDSLLWEVMFGEHVYTRFTKGLDRSHLQPWYYYFHGLYRAAWLYGAPWLTALGAVLVIVDAVRMRRTEVITILLWFAIPVTIMTFSSSKLYHYVYPVLPPIALATGYGPARVFQWTSAWLRNTDVNRRFAPAWAAHWRPLLTVASLVAVAVAAATVLAGRTIGAEFGTVRLRNTSIARPLFVAVGAGVLAGRGATAVQATLLVVILALLPVQQYKRVLERLPAEWHPWRSASACLAHVVAARARNRQPTHPVFAAMPQDRFLHPYSYYMRRVGAWDRVDAPPPDALLHARLHDPAAQRPIVIAKEWYEDYRRRTENTGAPVVAFEYVTLVMPGPYAACSSKARTSSQ